MCRSVRQTYRKDHAPIVRGGTTGAQEAARTASEVTPVEEEDDQADEEILVGCVQCIMH